jgi:hypothetical protein
MFSLKRERPISLNGLDNVVWFGTHRDKKREVTQFAERAFLSIWDDSMREAFDILGMMDRFQTMITDEPGTVTSNADGAERLAPVPGYQNRKLLRRATSNIDEVTTKFQRISTGDGVAICYTGDKKQALEQWKALTELLGQTTMMAIVTPGLSYYVQGTQVGYTPATRHLFKRSNTVERVGLPNEPSWRLNVSGYQIEIRGSWDEIKMTRKHAGYNLFQMLQLRLNEELETAIQKER